MEERLFLKLDWGSGRVFNLFAVRMTVNKSPVTCKVMAWPLWQEEGRRDAKARLERLPSTLFHHIMPVGLLRDSSNGTEADCQGPPPLPSAWAAPLITNQCVCDDETPQRLENNSRGPASQLGTGCCLKQARGHTYLPLLYFCSVSPLITCSLRQAAAVWLQWFKVIFSHRPQSSGD